MHDHPTVSRASGPREAIKEAFRRRREKQRWVLMALLVMVVAVVSLADSRTQAVLGVPSAVWAPAVFSVIGGAFVYTLFNWRCPACNRYLGRQPSPRVCGKCGARLQ